MNPATEQRIKQMDEQLDRLRAEYERRRALIKSPEYGEKVAEALGRIIRLFEQPMGERPDLYALMLVGRLQEIVQPFKEDDAVLRQYMRIREERQAYEAYR